MLDKTDTLILEGSLIGTLSVAKATTDGYAILIAANPMTILPSQFGTAFGTG
jgi:hypothetical protein